MAKREPIDKEELKKQPEPEKIIREPIQVQKKEEKAPAPAKKDGGCRI